MPMEKQTKSFELIEGRDDDIIEFLCQPQISASAACRAGLRLLMAQDEGEQDLTSMVKEILNIIKGGTAQSPPPEAPRKFNDPFLDQAL